MEPPLGAALEPEPYRDRRAGSATRRAEGADNRACRPAPGRRRRAGLHGLLALAALSLAGACGDRVPGSGGWRVVERLSAPPDAELFSSADVHHERAVRAWRLADPEQAAAWRVEPPAARGPVDRRGLWLRSADPSAGAPELTAEVRLDGDRVAALELRLRGPGRPASELLWAGPGETFSNDRRVAIEDSERHRDQGPIRVLRFAVGDHPRWGGSIRRLRLRPAVGSRRDFAVVSLRAIASRRDERLLGDAVARAWKVDLQRSIREARVAFPRRPWRARIPPPDETTVLRFAPGLSADLGGEALLTVRAVTAGGEVTELFSRAYAGRTGEWLEPVAVPLEPLVGRKSELEFALAGDGEGFAAWANVRLESRRREPPPPNVVLICLDTLRADHLSAYGYGRPTTPRIDRWAAERGVLFEQAVAPAPWTLPSFISIFTGLDAVRHASNYHQPASSELDMLAETLARRGYETVAWTGGAYLGPGHGLHQGFETFDYFVGGKERELAANVARVVEWLEAPRRRPFFLFFHTYEVHSPYLERQPFYDAFAASSGAPPIPATWVSPKRRPRRPEDGYQVSRELTTSPDRGASWEPLPAELAGAAVDRYDSGLRYADERIGTLLDALDRRGLAAGSVVILTSDHGEGLGEHGLAGHSYLYDFNLLVPLIIAAPTAGWPGGRRERRQVRSVDIAPTVLELVGLESEREMDGESLTPLVLDRPGAGDRPAWSYAAIANRGLSLRLPRLKYLFNNSAARPLFGRERLRDLARDPDERENVAGQRPGEAARLRGRVNRRLARELAAVWFHLRSAPQHPLTVELSGAELADPSRLKAMTLPGDGIRFAGTPPERAVIELPADSEALLYTEVSARGRLVLAAGPPWPGAARRRWRLSLEKLAEGAWSAAGAGTWTEGPVDTTSPGPWIEVFVSHDLGGGAEPGRADRQLEEQLRALGYLQ